MKENMQAFLGRGHFAGTACLKIGGADVFNEASALSSWGGLYFPLFCVESCLESCLTAKWRWVSPLVLMMIPPFTEMLKCTTVSLRWANRASQEVMGHRF